VPNIWGYNLSGGILPPIPGTGLAIYEIETNVFFFVISGFKNLLNNQNCITICRYDYGPFSMSIKYFRNGKNTNLIDLPFIFYVLVHKLDFST